MSRTALTLATAGSHDAHRSRELTSMARRFAGAIVLVMAWSPSPATAQAAPSEPISPPRLFAHDGGIVLNFIKPDKTADFEFVIERVKEAFSKSARPERAQQAAGWKVFRSPDPAGGNVLYVFLIDPAVPGSDYQISNLIAETFTPAEANDILKKYAESYAQGMNIVNLTLASDLGK